MTLDHVVVGVGDLRRAREFYVRALAPLGMEIQFEYPGGIAFGSDGQPRFLVKDGGGYGGPVHVAFAAPDTATVDAFHSAALAAGGTDNGAPGLRPEYHSRYYGAFVLDPDGHNIEAVTHTA